MPSVLTKPTTGWNTTQKLWQTLILLISTAAAQGISNSNSSASGWALREKLRNFSPKSSTKPYFVRKAADCWQFICLRSWHVTERLIAKIAFWTSHPLQGGKKASARSPCTLFLKHQCSWNCVGKQSHLQGKPLWFGKKTDPMKQHRNLCNRNGRRTSQTPRYQQNGKGHTNICCTIKVLWITFSISQTLL